jgi:hypothetical protein
MNEPLRMALAVRLGSPVVIFVLPAGGVLVAHVLTRGAVLDELLPAAVITTYALRENSSQGSRCSRRIAARQAGNCAYQAINT